MVKEETKKLLEVILTAYKDGLLHLNRLKDPNSDCSVDIKVGNTTYLDCNELIHHYRDENQMLAYTTTELIDKEERYYYLEIKDYSKKGTLQNLYPLHIILKRDSCVTRTLRTW